ncbi:tRNA methyltransferase 6 non-catalytic subunit [Ptiloglossa arizonensis]|uniref:tRNA methyltransferase 6 non-catalytic subunit n=1 Tax=Ptiloglossa arizonensis TaxID=3350558 RepID=UPI003F9FD10D
MDALAQLLSYSDVQSEGLYILYDSGSQGLPAAAMLNRIGANTEGHLINLHPGSVPQTTIIHAMNFPKEQLDRLVNVNIYSFLRLYHQGESAVLSNILALKKRRDNWTNKIKETVDKVAEKDCIDSHASQNEETNDKECLKSISDANEISGEQSTHSCLTATKRKLEECKSTEIISSKRPKWLLETQHAVDLAQNLKARGLAIVAKEHPLNIVTALLSFLGASRPFVIYHVYREPLQETYMMLKQRQNVINLKLFSNFLRSYQVLPDRTHPDILTSDTGGYLLTGYLVE